MKKENKRLDFNNQDFYVGIDVHKKQWTVTIRSQKIVLKTFTMNPSPEELSKYLKRNYPGGAYQSVYEAGFTGYWIHRELEKLGIKNKIASPTEIPTSSKEKLGKRDPVDSRKLARELENGSIESIYIISKFAEEFRSLVRQRSQIIKASARVKTQIKGYLDFYGHQLPKDIAQRSWSLKFINYLREQKFAYPMGKTQLEIYIDQLLGYRNIVNKLTKEIKKYIKEYKLERTIELLCSVPGIGFTTAIVLLAELIDINRFKNFDSLASYCGLVPTIMSSDQKEVVLGLKLLHNKQIRQLLVESSWMAIRKDPALTEAYGRYKKSMVAQKAIIKVARKLLNRIRYVWLNQKLYVMAVVN
jgi:transposase